MNPRRFVLAVVWLAFVPAAGWLLSGSAPVQSLAFQRLVNEESYLANLRDPELGCRSLPFRQAGLVVIGDSHSYAGWDFSALQKGTGMRVGACALGGLYLDSVPLLLDFVVRSSPVARVVVLGVSPRMFWESGEKADQVAHHAKAIPELRPGAKPFLRQRLGLEVLPYDAERAAAARHAPRIESLDEVQVAERLRGSRTAIRTLRDWDRRLRESTFSAGTAEISGKVCAVLKKAGLKLWLVHLPESPDLESRYDNGIWKAYLEHLAGLSACAEKVVTRRAVDYELGNRHYVNRQLLDSHDYGMWTRPAPLQVDSAFDADHLNPVGAQRFTRALLGRPANE